MNEREELEKLRSEKASLVKRLDDALALRKKHVADAIATLEHVRDERDRLKDQLIQADMVINGVHYHIHAEHCDIRKASALITKYWNKTQKEAK